MVKDKELARRVFACIDNTTLAATDNEQTVADFCRHTLDMHLADGTTVAAVCVYPRFARLAHTLLEGSGIKVVAVSNDFPHGQSDIIAKLSGINGLVCAGADEIDIVINRGLVIEGRLDEAAEEIRQQKMLAQGRTLKVILETCELTAGQIYQASAAAIRGGADFIKTSTGKGAGGATIEAAEVMLNCIKDNVKINKKPIGFKAAGGIRKPEDALEYVNLAKKIMGDNYINNQTFRIGASRLTEGMFSLLTF